MIDYQQARYTDGLLTGSLTIEVVKLRNGLVPIGRYIKFNVSGLAAGIASLAGVFMKT